VRCGRWDAARFSGLIAAVVLLPAFAGCGSEADSSQVLGDTVDLTPANAGDLPSGLDFAARDVRALGHVCDRIDLAASGEALGGDVARYVWADAECVFDVSDGATSARDLAPARLVVAMISSEEGDGGWRATSKVLRLTDTLAEIDAVGDGAFFAPRSGSLYVLEGSQLLLFQHLPGAVPAPRDLAGVLAGIARRALADRIGS
jgi:hypothetical protein